MSHCLWGSPHHGHSVTATRRPPRQQHYSSGPRCCHLVPPGPHQRHQAGPHRYPQVLSVPPDATKDPIGTPQVPISDTRWPSLLPATNRDRTDTHQVPPSATNQDPIGTHRCPQVPSVPPGGRHSPHHPPDPYGDPRPHPQPSAPDATTSPPPTAGHTHPRGHPIPTTPPTPPPGLGDPSGRRPPHGSPTPTAAAWGRFPDGDPDARHLRLWVLALGPARPRGTDPI